MKSASLPLLALAASFSCGTEIPTLGGQSKDPPPPIYIGPTAAAKPAAPDTSAPPPSAPAQSGSNNLEKLAMPIALHPDSLIASILPASVYPLEIVQAARFVRDTNNITKVDEQPWDENVKAVAKFPDLIAKMDADLPWTMALGQAFIDQPKELMDTIQSLRAKAHKAGTLQSSPQQVVTVTNVVIIQTNVSQVVTVTNQIVQVRPSNPEVVYVPSYPPTVYYPPPAYDPITPLVTFGVGMAWGAVLANNCNWGHGEVDIDIDHNVNRNVNRTTERSAGQSGARASSTGAKAGQQKWQPDQSRMRNSGAPTSAQTQQARGWGGAGNQPAQRSSGGAGGARPSAQPSTSGQRPGASASPRPSQAGAGASSANRSGSSAGAGARSSPSPSANRSGSSSAFSGMNSGGSARDSSSRGASSRGGGGGSGGRGGGGGRR